ncbi:MAG TPA: glycosyl transferase, partial [Stellaceae bacterium]|nr:glycosyl transferase [Stellaceae bacterium]
MFLVLTVAVVSFAVSCLGTRALIAVLRRRAVLDRPNERSSHIVPTPRGGGIAVIGVSVCAWLALCTVGISPPSFIAVA